MGRGDVYLHALNNGAAGNDDGEEEDTDTEHYCLHPAGSDYGSVRLALIVQKTRSNCAARAERARLHGAEAIWLAPGDAPTARSPVCMRHLLTKGSSVWWSGLRGRGMWPVGPNRVMVSVFRAERRRPNYLDPTFVKVRRRILFHTAWVLAF